jgi:hypothetical protein
MFLGLGSANSAFAYLKPIHSRCSAGLLRFILPPLPPMKHVSFLPWGTRLGKQSHLGMLTVSQHHFARHDERTDSVLPRATVTEFRTVIVLERTTSLSPLLRNINVTSNADRVGCVLRSIMNTSLLNGRVSFLLSNESRRSNCPEF